jgi:hypothetical protein
MKTILFILAIALSSCSTDDSQDREEEPANCTCETILRADTFHLPSGYVWTVATLENDCTGAQRQRDLVGVHTIGEKICN